MTTKRRKADKLPLPQTTEEAIDKLGRYAELDAKIEAARAEAEAEIARIRAACDIVTAPLETELKATFNVLKPWWAVEGETLTEGKRKSLELGGCLIGHRMTPPKVVFSSPFKTLDDVITNWVEEDDETFIRHKYELDKGQVLDALLGRGLFLSDDTEELKGLGFKLVQKEEFFIDRLPPKAAAVEIVAAPAEQVPA